MKISIVIPTFNSAAQLEPLTSELQAILGDSVAEIILVNDGSRDNTEEVGRAIAQKDKNITFVSLRKNFGEHNAVLCGLQYVTGEAVVIMDDDFQNPPSEVPKLVAELQKGYDVVYSRYEKKHHEAWRNWGSSVHNVLATYLLEKPSELYLSSFKAINRSVVEEIRKYHGPFPYIDGLIFRVTRNIGTVLVAHQDRREGTSQYTFFKLLALHSNLLMNFSVLPLRVFTLIGLCVFLLGTLLSGCFILEKLLYPSTQVGWTSIMVGLMSVSGLQMLFLGLIGEYLGRQYLTLNTTPPWVVKSAIVRGKENSDSMTSR